MATAAVPGQKVATIAGIDPKATEWCEVRARELAKAAEAAVLEKLCADVVEEGGGQLLLQRALHHLARRITLAHLAAAAREADLNDPSQGLHSRISEPAGLGYDRRLVELIPKPMQSVATPTAAPAQVVLRAGHTYVFYSSATTSTQVSEFPAQQSGVRIVLDGSLDSSNSLNPCGPGVLRLPDVALPVFVKEKQPQAATATSFDALLRRTAIEAGTCAALAPLQCFLRICAVQVLPDRVWLAYEKLQGQTIDEFLEAAEGQQLWANEHQVLGALILVLKAYIKLGMAGYCQRDVKSANLWLSRESDGRPKVIVIDSDACFKVGHIGDARLHGYTNEAWQVKAVNDRELWRFGGAGNTCTVHAANVDLISKQCIPGEQAMVFSLSEIALRMIGKGDVVFQCDDDTPWQDYLIATVHCNLFDENRQDMAADISSWLGPFGLQRARNRERQPLPKVRPMQPPAAAAAAAAAKGGVAPAPAAAVAGCGPRAGMNNPGYQAVPPAEREFVITISRQGMQGQPGLLGLEARDTREGLIIQAILPGLLQQWNDGHPQQAARPGDTIVEVNGMRQTQLVMMKEELARSSDLQLRIRPQEVKPGNAGPPRGAKTYSPQFLHLMMSLRRRSFTQGGADVCMDMWHTAFMLKDFVERHLGATEASCIDAFACYIEDVASQSQGSSWLKTFEELPGLPSLTAQLTGSWGKAGQQDPGAQSTPLAAAAEFMGQQFQSMAERMSGSAGAPKRR